MPTTRTQANMRHHALYYHGPIHIRTAEQAIWGVGPDLTITRYTEDCEERARSMQHLVNSLGKEQGQLMYLAINFSCTTT